MTVFGTAGNALVHIVDHVDRARDDLLWQFKDSPRLVSLVEAMANAVQIFEDEAWNVYINRALQDAEGDQIDKFGAIVGEARGGLSDADYRKIIEARALAYTCVGLTDQFIDMFSFLTAPSTVRWEPLYPAGHTLYAFRDLPMEELYRNRVGRVMRSAKTGGVAMELIEARTRHFGFDLDPNAEPYNVGIWARIV